jgi:hypothetical protein
MLLVTEVPALMRLVTPPRLKPTRKVSHGVTSPVRTGLGIPVSTSRKRLKRCKRLTVHFEAFPR